MKFKLDENLDPASQGSSAHPATDVQTVTREKLNSIDDGRLVEMVRPKTVA